MCQKAVSCCQIIQWPDYDNTVVSCHCIYPCLEPTCTLYRSFQCEFVWGSVITCMYSKYHVTSHHPVESFPMKWLIRVNSCFAAPKDQSCALTEYYSYGQEGTTCLHKSAFNSHGMYMYTCTQPPWPKVLMHQSQWYVGGGKQLNTIVCPIATYLPSQSHSSY